jgi:hypothetical protein
MRKIFMLLVHMLGSHALAVQPGKVYRLDDVTTSPLENIVIENYRLNESMINEKVREKVDTVGSTITQGQIWFSEANNRDNRILFASYPRVSYRSSSFLFSPDEKRLVTNIHDRSDYGTIALYQKTGPLQYKNVHCIDSGVLWDFFDHLIGHNSTENKLSKRFDHRYVRAIRWSTDSSAFLISLTGEVSGDIYLTDWLCVFDLNSRKLTLDLKPMNRKAWRRERD